MNRLWVRLSVTFGMVLLVANFLPLIVFGLMMWGGWWEIPMPPDVPPELADQLRARILERVPIELVQITVVSAVLGLIAGAWTSRNLAAPLQKLESAATAIGEQDLSRRVTLDRSSREIDAVAQAFNEMAGNLEEAEQMRQQLLADVAHEIRTPLSVIQGNLRAILDDVYPLDKEEVARLYDQTRHLTHLVEDLRELSQAEAQRLPLHKTAVETVNLLQEAGALFRPLAREQGIELRVELLGKVPPVHVDRRRMTQVLHNLLNNALRHTPAGGQVTLQAEPDGDTVVVRIIDTGEGIAAEHLPHVFDRFYRTDTSRQRFEDQSGAGLGLAIARAMVLAHQGTITVDSDGRDRGTTFTVRLPVPT